MPVSTSALGAKLGPTPVRRIYRGSTVVAPGVCNLVPNPSFELASGTPTVRTNLVLDPAGATSKWGGRWFGGGTNTGTYAYGQTPSGLGAGLPNTFTRKTWTVVGTGNGAGNTGFSVINGASRFSVSQGQTYAFSGWLRSTGTGKGGQATLVWYDVNNAIITTTGGAFVTLTTAWQKVTVTSTPPANAVTVAPFLDVNSGPTWAVGDTLDGTGALLEALPVILPYFDGSISSADPDLTNHWTGSVNNSTSTQTGAGLPIAPGTHAAVVQSSAWASTGGKSLRIIPNGPLATTTDSYARVDLKALAGTVDGLTFTALAKLHVPAPMTGPLQGGTQMRNLFVDISGGGGPTRYLGGASTANSPNVAGDYVHRLTFTVPSVQGDPVTALGVRLYSGAAPGGGDVYWDDVVIVQGAYSGPYRDGSAPGWAWDGAANASASRGLS